MTLKRGTSLDVILWRMRKVTWWQTPTVLWLGGGTISPSYSTCMCLRNFGRAEVKSHKSPGIDQIPAELIKARGRTICLEIYKLITSIWKKEKLPEERKESIIIPIHKKGDKTDCNNYRGISLLPNTYKILSSILLSRLIPYAKKIIGIISVAFDATSRLLIIYSTFAKYLRKNGNKMNQFISSL